MKTYNFNLNYLEIALLSIKYIDEENYCYIISLIEYLQSVEKYSLDFPMRFRFNLPNGKEDKEYMDVKIRLIEMNLYDERNRYIRMTRLGECFFEKLEQKCIEVEQAFEHYKVFCC